MADPLSQEAVPYPHPPDISHLVMEDNEPVDGTFSELQRRLLVDALYDSWVTDRDFVAQANVGVFYGLNAPAVVPDVFLSLDVQRRQDVFDRGRSYLAWEYGKPPDVVIEVVSNPTGGEMEKLDRYASFGVPYVVIFDPEHHLSGRTLRGWQHHGKEYVELAHLGALPGIGLGLTLWEGTFQDVEGQWLRWCDADGNLLPLGAESAEREAERAEREAERAEREAERAEREAQRAERLAARLRELGVEDV